MRKKGFLKNLILIIVLLLALTCNAYPFSKMLSNEAVESTAKVLFPALFENKAVIKTIHSMTQGKMLSDVLTAASLGLDLRSGMQIGQTWLDDTGIEAYRVVRIYEKLGIDIEPIAWDGEKTLEKVIGSVTTDINKILKIMPTIKTDLPLSSAHIALVSSIRTIAACAALIVEQSAKSTEYSDYQALASISMLIELAARITGPFDSPREPYTQTYLDFKDVFRRFIGGTFDDSTGNLASYEDSLKFLELMLAHQWHILESDLKPKAEFLVRRSVMNLMTIYETHGILKEAQARAIDVENRIPYIESLAGDASVFMSNTLSGRRKF